MSVWVAGQEGRQLGTEQVCGCLLLVVVVVVWAARTRGILGTELVRTLWAPSLPLGGDMGGRERWDRVTCTMVKVD